MSDSAHGMDNAMRPEYGSEAIFQPATPEPFYDQRERLREVSESYYDPKSGGSFYKDTPEPLYQQADAELMGLHDRPKSHLLLETNLDATANENGLPTPPHPPSRSKSEALLETNLDSYLPSSGQHSQPFAITAASRSKSQPLETAM